MEDSTIFRQSQSILELQSKNPSTLRQLEQSGTDVGNEERKSEMAGHVDKLFKSVEKKL